MASVSDLVASSPLGMRVGARSRAGSTLVSQQRATSSTDTLPFASVTRMDSAADCTLAAIAGSSPRVASRSVSTTAALEMNSLLDADAAYDRSRSLACSPHGGSSGPDDAPRRGTSTGTLCALRSNPRRERGAAKPPCERVK